MSIFRPVDIDCPACGSPVTFQMVFSVNADRRPDLRDAILDRTFQEETCAACDYTFRVEPQFSYMDMRRGQFLAVWPAENVLKCDEFEARSQDIFDQAYGEKAPSEAQDIGQLLTPRVVFGWTGLNEKIIAGDLELDDVTLEIAKVAIIRSTEDSRLASGAELRLLGREGDGLNFGWFSFASENLEAVFSVPLSLIQEIEEGAEEWGPMRGELSQGIFVDYRRFFMGNPA